MTSGQSSSQSSNTLRISGSVCNDKREPIASAAVDVLVIHEKTNKRLLGSARSATNGSFTIQVQLQDDARRPLSNSPLRLQSLVSHGSYALSTQEYHVQGDSFDIALPETYLSAGDSNSKSDGTVTINDPTVDFATPFGGAGQPVLGGGAADIDDTIDAEFQRLLGRTFNTDDPSAPTQLFDQLKRAFKPVPHDDGSLDYEWSPILPSAGGQPEVDTPLTGPQAVLIERARDGYADAVRRINALEPIISDFDTQNAGAAKLIVIALVDDLVDHLSKQIPPNNPRVDQTIQLLKDELKSLAEIYGYDQGAGQLEKAEDYTTFLLVEDYIVGLEAAWLKFKADQVTHPQGSLGTQIVLVQRGLTSVDDAVREVYRRLDTYGMTLGLRRTNDITFKLDPNGPKQQMLVQDLLGWIEGWTPGARRLARGAGEPGLRVIGRIAYELHRLVVAVKHPNGKVSHYAWEKPQVIRALESLAEALDDVITAAKPKETPKPQQAARAAS
jgi:hypothetical protein